jgi:predicted nicotinamide N-methyase
MGDQHAADRNVLPFVLEGVKIEVRELPATPAIKLYLMADDYPQESLPQMDYQRLMSAPPYWAFCWGGGQALAQWILNHPELVRGQAVVDFGAGSGIAGIAAALAGAKSVLCVDVDPGALCACQRNATLNDVAIATSDRMQNLDGALLLAADVCYEDEGYAGVINHVINGGRAIVAESSC